VSALDREAALLLCAATAKLKGLKLVMMAIRLGETAVQQTVRVSNLVLCAHPAVIANRFVVMGLSLLLAVRLAKPQRPVAFGVKFNPATIAAFQVRFVRKQFAVKTVRSAANGAIMEIPSLVMGAVRLARKNPTLLSGRVRLLQ
jgi:hypothetical protein